MGKGLFSDSKETVTSSSGLTPTILDWRTYEEIRKAWSIQTNEPNQITASHCSRNNPNIVIAHRLTKRGRLYGWDNWGSTEPIFQLEELYRKVFCLSYFCTEIFLFYLKNKECEALM